MGLVSGLFRVRVGLQLFTTSKGFGTYPGDAAHNAERAAGFVRGLTGGVRGAAHQPAEFVGVWIPQALHPGNFVGSRASSRSQ